MCLIYNVSKNPSNAHMGTSGILSINTPICFGLSAQTHTELTIYDYNIKGLIQFFSTLNKYFKILVLFPNT